MINSDRPLTRTARDPVVGSRVRGHTRPVRRRLRGAECAAGVGRRRDGSGVGGAGSGGGWPLTGERMSTVISGACVLGARHAWGASRGGFTLRGTVRGTAPERCARDFGTVAHRATPDAGSGAASAEPTAP